MIIQSLLILFFLFIFFQDYKNRLVYWFLFPSIGLLSFYIQFSKIGIINAGINAIFNLFFTFLILITCYLYSRFKLKKNIKEALGIGDILFFLFISLTFSITSFFVFFVFSLLFSLSLHQLLKHKNKDKTVPLAGYMSLFFATVYLMDLIFNYIFLYTN